MSGPCHSVRFADLNGDGKKDYLVVDNNNGAIHAWMNGGGQPGDWGWSDYGVVASGLAPGANIQLADVDGDGKADYLIVDPKTGGVDLWLNQGGRAGDWGWNPYWGHIAGGLAPGAQIRFADITGDGRADYLIVDPKTGAVDLWINKGGTKPNDWGWDPGGIIATGIGVRGDHVRFADINNDGYDEYLGIEKNGSVTAYLNRGKGNPGVAWDRLGQIAPGDGPMSLKHQVEEADINGDGKADHLSLDPTNGAMHAWLSTGLDASAPPKAPGWIHIGQIASGIGSDIRFADLDGDGKKDYLSLDAKTGAVVAYLNGVE